MKKESSSFAIKLLTVVGIVGVILMVGGFVYLSQKDIPQITNDAIGMEGSKCGGPERLPCSPGFVCDIPNGGMWGSDYGICTVDKRTPATIVGEGEECDDVLVKCGAGLRCADSRCEAIFDSTKPFIMSLIPEGMELIKGSYQANVGTEVKVRVHALNVQTGEIYLKPLWSSHSGVSPEEKIADLRSTGAPNEYEASFSVEEKLAANLIAVMKNEDGQEAQLSITVSETIE